MGERVQFSEIEDGIVCRISGWRYWLCIFTWPIMFPFLLAMMFEPLYNPNSKIAHGAGMQVFMIVWTIFCCLLVLEWLRMTFGQEIIKIRDGKLTIRYEIVHKWGWEKVFDVSEIRCFSVHSPFGPPNMWRVSLLSVFAMDDYAKYMSRGSISFECNGKIKAFGPKLTEEEANSVFSELTRYLPDSATK